MSTIRPNQPFDVNRDAKILRNAMHGIGTDEKAIITVLSGTTNEQRQEIKTMFKTMFGKDLKSEFKSELSGHFEDLVLALLLTPIEYDVKELKRSVKGAGTDEDALIDILCTKTNAEIHAINAAYKTHYKTKLESDIASDTSSFFKRLLISVCTGNRSEDEATNSTIALRLAHELYEAGEDRLGTDESEFIEILGTHSYDQINLIGREYKKLSKKTLKQAVMSEFSGDIQKGLLAILSVAENIPAYFAEKLYKSMKGAGTKDKALIRLVVSRCEVDMVQIKQEFERTYGKSLESFIQGDTSGDYKALLLALIAG